MNKEGQAEQKPRIFTIGEQRLRIIDAPKERLDAVLDTIDGAKATLRLFYYIFQADACGRKVLDRLVAAAERGVDVALIVDGFGSGDTPDAFFAPLVKAGGKFDRFSARPGFSYLIRNHQKMAIADGAAVVIGGFNIADDYFGEEGETRWEDIGLVVEGDKVEELCRRFDELAEWTRGGHPGLRDLRRIVRNWRDIDGPIDWLAGGPTNNLSPWARTFQCDLDKGERLDIVAAYFTPGRGMLKRIGKIAERGKARLVLAGKTDNGATIGAARLLYGHLLRRGAEIREYRPCRLHTKLIAIDDHVYIGSANLDVRSLFINLELMARIEDAEFADHVRALIESKAADSIHVTEDLHRARGTLFSRLRWALSYFVVSTLDYTVNRRLNFGLRF